MSDTPHTADTGPSRRVRRSVGQLLGAVDRLIAAAEQARRARDELRRLTDADAKGGDHAE